MFGVLNVGKPSGCTSRDVVNRVQRHIRPIKVGHAGTLDPLATGVLVLCVGGATRLVPYVQRMRKSYVATFLLGAASDTDDVEGEVRPLPDARRPTRAEVERVLPEFCGEILQRPPAYSAVKIAGRRAYDLARRGQQVELEARPVMVHQLRLTTCDDSSMTLEVECGSGTYIRALGRDIAARLGTAAVMSALARTAVGVFRLAGACDAEALDDEQNIRRLLLPAKHAVAELPSLQLSAEQLGRIANGIPIEAPVGRECAGFAPDGRLAAILTPTGAGKLRPMRNFTQTF